MAEPQAGRQTAVVLGLLRVRLQAERLTQAVVGVATTMEQPAQVGQGLLCSQSPQGHQFRSLLVSLKQTQPLAEKMFTL